VASVTGIKGPQNAPLRNVNSSPGLSSSIKPPAPQRDTLRESPPIVPRNEPPPVQPRATNSAGKTPPPIVKRSESKIPPRPPRNEPEAEPEEELSSVPPVKLPPPVMGKPSGVKLPPPIQQRDTPREPPATQPKYVPPPGKLVPPPSLLAKGGKLPPPIVSRLPIHHDEEEEERQEVAYKPPVRQEVETPPEVLETQNMLRTLIESLQDSNALLISSLAFNAEDWKEATEEIPVAVEKEPEQEIRLGTDEDYKNNPFGFEVYTPTPVAPKPKNEDNFLSDLDNMMVTIVLQFHNFLGQSSTSFIRFRYF